MRIANNLARLILFGALLLGTLTVPGCGEGKSSSQNNLCADATAPGCQGAGGDTGQGRRPALRLGAELLRRLVQ